MYAVAMPPSHGRKAELQTPPAPAPWSPPTPLPGRHETPRLVLRWWTSDDAAPMLAALNHERSTHLPWLPWVAADNRSIAECIFNIERFRRERDRPTPTPEDFTLGIFDRASGAVVGGTGLVRVRHTIHEAELGYWIRADRRCEGLCTEAVAGLLSWAFTPQRSGGWGLRRVHIRCSAKNAASARVPEKLGLRREACFAGDRWTDGIGWDDTLVYAVLASEWDVPRERMLTPAQSPNPKPDHASKRSRR